jgi:predicted CoA-binding protein
MNTLSSIQEFLGRKRFAVVGVSRDPKDFTRGLFREFIRRGYDAVPVNPAVSEVEGIGCFKSVNDVSPPVEGALLLTNSSVTGQVVQECAQAGVRQVWMYRAAGAGAVDAEAVRFCESKGINVVEGECPYMFLPSPGFPHNFHGFCLKLFGRYPR